MKAKLVNEVLNEKFSSAENALRIDVRWTNKAKDLSEVKPLYITPRIQPYLDKIKTVPYYVLDQKLVNSIPGKLQDKIFICLGVDGEKYLVNPEGWDYPRYTAHLVIPTEQQLIDSELDEKLLPNAQRGPHYPLQALNYESSEGDSDFMHGLTGDELECEVCGHPLLPEKLENGLCRQCIEQGFWKDRNDVIHHGSDKNREIPTY